MENIKISVIMSTYNEPKEYLCKAIDSILGQSYKQFEFLIVIDNPDNQEIQYIVRDYSEKDNRITIIDNKKNIGLTNSLNKALHIAKGEYIARMDADDISLPNRFLNQLQYIENTGYDLIGSQIVTIDENGKEILFRKIPTEASKVRKLLGYVNIIQHPAWFGKKEVFERLNGYRDIRACEDYDFLLRALMENFQIGNTPEVCLYYRNNMSGISRTQKSVQRLTAHYLCSCFKKGKKVSEKQIQNYLGSRCGQKELSKLDFYYAKAKNIFPRKMNKPKWFFYTAFWLLATKYGRLSLRDILIQQIICNKV